jgi:hypothetical protein
VATTFLNLLFLFGYMSSEDNTATRRYVLQTLGALGGTAGVAGCLGGYGGSDPEGSDTPDDTVDESTPEPTEAEGDGQDYSLPESAHRTPGQMASDWGTVFRHDEGEFVDAYSPSQTVESGREPWTRSWAGGEEYYPMFDWEPMHVPETIVQWTPDVPIKVDQLPGGVTHEEVKSDLQEAGYEQAGTQGNYDIMVNRDEGRARAVGDGYHVLSIGRYSEADLDRKRMDVENVVEAYNSGENKLQSDMQDMKERLDLEDTFAASVSDEGGYVTGMGSSELEAIGGAITINLDQGTKRGIWKFEDEGKAGTVQAVKTNDDHSLSRGFESLQQEDQYLIAEGSFENIEGHYFSPIPRI